MERKVRKGRGGMDPNLLAAKIASSQIPRFKRRGSVLRREALARLLRGKAVASADETTSLRNGSAGPGNPLGVKGIPNGQTVTHTDPPADSGHTQEPKGVPVVAWGEKPPAGEQSQRRLSSLKLEAVDAHNGQGGHVSPSVDTNTVDFHDIEGYTLKRRESQLGLDQRTKAVQDRRMSRRMESALRVNDLEQSSVEKVENAFRTLYVPPLGPLDDPPGVIYLDGKLTEKTVDVGVLNGLGESVQAVRKELFDLTTKRRSLVEDARAQNRRLSAGFPRDLAGESMQEKRMQEADAHRKKAESKLKRLLNHRRRLLDVLKASQAEDDKAVPSSSKVARSELSQTEAAAVIVGTSGGGSYRKPRRSSLEDLKDLVGELSTISPVAQLVPERAIATVDCARRTSAATAAAAAQEKQKAKEEIMRLNQGWREVIAEVFPEKKDMRRYAGGFTTGKEGDDDGGKEAEIRGFMEATAAREHVEFLIAAMNPARARDLPAVVKCLLLHYTGPAADELELLLGGRMISMEVQDLLELTLEALDTVHTAYVSSVLMLQWLLARAPHLRALLMRGGVLRRAFRRLEKTEAKGLGPGARAMQYGALSLIIGILFS